MKKSNQFVGFKSGDNQLFEVLKLLGGASSLHTYLKAYKTKKTKVFLPYERLDCPEKVNNKTIKSLLPITPSSAFCAITTPLKKITTTLKTLLTVVQQQSKQ